MISTSLKFRILELKSVGKSFYTIAKELKIAESTVKRWYDRYVSTGEMDIKKGQGRKRCLTEFQESKLIQAIENNKFETYEEAKNLLRVNCSRRTLNKYAIKNGYSEYF